MRRPRAVLRLASSAATPKRRPVSARGNVRRCIQRYGHGCDHDTVKDTFVDALEGASKHRCAPCNRESLGTDSAFFDRFRSARPRRQAFHPKIFCSASGFIAIAVNRIGECAFDRFSSSRSHSKRIASVTKYAYSIDVFCNTGKLQFNSRARSSSIVFERARLSGLRVNELARRDMYTLR